MVCIGNNKGEIFYYIYKVTKIKSIVFYISYKLFFYSIIENYSISDIMEI